MLFKYTNLKLHRWSAVLAAILGVTIPVTLAVFVTPGIVHAVTWDNSLNISVSPQSPAVGGNVTLNITSPNFSIFDGAAGEVWVCVSNDCGEKKKLKDFKWGQNSASVSVPLDPAYFTANQSATLYVVVGQNSGDGILSFFNGKVTFTPVASNASGPTLNIAEKSTDLKQAGRTGKVFSVVLSGTDRVPTRYVIDCGQSNGVSGQLVYQSPENKEFECSYPMAAGGPYNGTITVYDANGEIASGTFQVTITGKEREGGLNPPGVDDPFRFYVVSILTPIFLAIQSFLFLLYFTLIMPIIIAIGSIQTGLGACNTATGVGFFTNICGAWQIIRNLVNMIFILVMIIIGIATILRLQAYNYKRLLGKLIIMAILVNFSLVIAQAFLKLFDILRFTFMDPSSIWQMTKLGYKLIGYHLVTVGGTDPVKALFGALGLQFTIPGQILVVAAELLNLSMSLLATVAMGAIAAYMVIAMVALRILLILSPFWPVLLVVPAGAGLARAWWMNFFKYGLFLPILLFFMRIAVELMDKPFFGQIQDGCEVLKAADASASCDGMGMFAKLVFNGLMQVEAIVFVFAGLMVARKLSLFSSGALTNFGSRAMMLPLVGAGAVGGFALGAAKSKAGRFWNEYTTNKILGHRRDISPERLALFALANPVATFQALKKRGERLSEERREKAVAGAEQGLEQLFTSGRVSKDRMYDVEDMEVKKAMKDKTDYNRDQQVEEASRALRLGNSDEERAIARGDLIYNPMHSGFIDDLVTDSPTAEFVEKMKNDVKQQMQEAGLSEQEAEQQAEEFMFYTDKDGQKRIKYDPLMGVATAFYRAKFGNDPVAWRMIAEQGEIGGKKTNHAEYMALSKKQADGTYAQAGKFVVETDQNGNRKARWENEAGALYAAREWAKLPSRVQAAIAWHAIRGIGTEGEINTHLWEATANALAENPTFAQQRTAGKLLTEDQDYMSSDAGKELIRSGVMQVNRASFNAVQAMFNQSPIGAQAVAGLYNRMLGLDMSKAGIAKTLREGIKLKSEDGSEVVLRDPKLEAELAEQAQPANASAAEAVKEGYLADSHNKDALKTRLENASASGAIPQFSELVNAINDLAKNTTAAQNIARTHIEKLAEKKTEQIDFGKEVSNVTEARALKLLPPQELSKLVEAVAKGARQGLVNASRHPESATGRRMVEIRSAIVQSVADAKIGGLKNEKDIYNKIDTRELVSSIYKKTSKP